MKRHPRSIRAQSDHRPPSSSAGAEVGTAGPLSVIVVEPGSKVKGLPEGGRLLDDPV